VFNPIKDTGKYVFSFSHNTEIRTQELSEHLREQRESRAAQDKKSRGAFIPNRCSQISVPWEIIPSA
jgi:hypothetical protein